jgi:tetratricopeptide (TPR) repeat protein
MKNHTHPVAEPKWLEHFTAGLAALDANNLTVAKKKLGEAAELAVKLNELEPLIKSLLALSDAQRFSGQLKDAEDSLKRSIEFARNHPDNHPIIVAICHGGLGQLYVAQYKVDEAIVQLELAVKTLRKHRHLLDPESLPIFIALTSCYLDTQEYERADKLARYTHDLSVALVGPNDATTLMVMNMCASAAVALGKPGRADILKNQIRTTMQNRGHRSDELGIGAALLDSLRANGVIDTRPVVLDFGKGAELTLNQDVADFNNLGSKKSEKKKKNSNIHQSSQPNLISTIPKDSVLALRIALRGIEPLIWRRIEVPASITLPELHLVLQIAMGWRNSHLHSFYIGDNEYGIDDPAVIDERNVELYSVLKVQTPGFWYRYDFGDDWLHDIQIEWLMPKDSDNEYPKCVEGSRSCPPEDCGGEPGYIRLLSALNDPSDEEHESMIEWVGEHFNADEFDLDEVNARLKRLRSVKSRSRKG